MHNTISKAPFLTTQVYGLPICILLKMENATFFKTIYIHYLAY